MTDEPQLADLIVKVEALVRIRQALKLGLHVEGAAEDRRPVLWRADRAAERAIAVLARLRAPNAAKDDGTSRFSEATLDLRSMSTFLALLELIIAEAGGAEQ